MEFGADEYYEFSILHNSTYALSASGFDVYEESSGNARICLCKESIHKAIFIYRKKTERLLPEAEI